MKQITIGILAHVDAGKTTLSESLLYNSKAIKKAGRVDHGDSHLDTDEIERKRGITVFSAQASFNAGDTKVVLIDTPGHVDFAAETERVLPVLDYALLLISAAEGIQSHTKTLWQLLDRYHIPVIVFFNKMDISENEENELIARMNEAFSDGFVNFMEPEAEAALEDISLVDEGVMELFLEEGRLDKGLVSGLIRDRKLFPCIFGSALLHEGVKPLIKVLNDYTLGRSFGDDFAAKVYKITYAPDGKRLTHMRVTGGSISIRQEITGNIPVTREENEEGDTWSEKITEIRVYDGERFENVNSAEKGDVVAVCGLTHTVSGMGLGADETFVTPTLAPVLTYNMTFEGNIDAAAAWKDISILEDELPELSLEWDKAARAVKVRLMGEVQTEILTSIIKDRFGYVVSFGQSRIAYKETIADVVEGVGHFEPLRHYAEVHLRMEPLERGSGLIFDSDCPQELLAVNWQRLVLTHLRERVHKGVLTGSPITDMRIVVTAGRAHPKHTEGGDFRQATYRAVRHGLMKAVNVLLEPYYHFTLSIPSSQIGRAMTDIEAMSGKCNPPVIEGDEAELTGIAPVSEMHGYASNVLAYTGGEGRIALNVAGYYACHNAEDVILERGYDPESDVRNPSGSVFCTHGAGFVVPWDQVEDYMHVEASVRNGSVSTDDMIMPVAVPKAAKSKGYSGSLAEDKELLAIFEREFGQVKTKRYNEVRRISPASNPDIGGNTERYQRKAKEKEERKRAKRKSYLLVDGYNVIHSQKELKELAEEELSAARGKLCDMLCNYQGFTGRITIVVFDAYKVPGNTGSVEKYNNIYVIYTKEAESADAYIEKATHEIAKEHDVMVATSDGMVQLIVLGAGAIRMSSNELIEDMERISSESLERERVKNHDQGSKDSNGLFG